MKEFTALDVFDLICAHVAGTGNGMSYADIRDHFDARCRYPLSTELSLIEAGHRIMLGAQRITKSRILELIKEEKR